MNTSQTRLLLIVLYSLVLFGFLTPHSVNAWVFHEHWYLTSETIKAQSADYQEKLDRVWKAVTEGEGSQFCDSPIGTEHGFRSGKPCVDFATWPAMAGDHSCGPNDLWEISRNEEWILKVIDVAGTTADRLKKSKSIEERKNWVDVMHLAMENADMYYSTRAEAGGTHFMLPRNSQEELASYFLRCTAEDAPVNALGMYAIFHLSALSKAHSAFLTKDAEEKHNLLKASMLAEAYAHHFLQDTFASGHTVGSWDSAAWRKGTHDYYCEEGVDAHLWNGEDYAAYGDGYMRAQDVERAVAVLSISMQQVIDVAVGSGPWASEIPLWDLHQTQEVVDAYSCKIASINHGVSADVFAPIFQPILAGTIKPGLGIESAHMPRVRSEIGPFVRLYSSGRFGMAFKGYASEESYNGRTYDSAPRFRGGLSIGGGFGVGLDGVSGKSGDGAMFVQGAFVVEPPQYDGYCGDCEGNIRETGHRGKGAPFPRVPGRSGIEMRIRLPYLLIPGDLILAAPVLAFASPALLKAMAIRSVRGGLIPWQMVMKTKIGSFQFVVGREFGITWYGYTAREDLFFYQTPPDTGYETDFHPVIVKSIELDFPLLDYRPFRSFSTKITSSVIIQLGLSVEINTYAQVQNIPENQTLRIEEGAQLSLEPSLTVYLRLAFDGRLYL